LKLDGINDSSTCLKAFNDKALVGTTNGNLIILDTEMALVIVDRHELSERAITSIRLFEEQITVYFNQNEFISGELNGDKLVNKRKHHRYHLVHDARYVKDSPSDELLTLGSRKIGTKIEACIQHRKVGGIRSISDNKGPWASKSFAPQILDVSDEGMILMVNRDGLIHLRNSSDSTINAQYDIGNSLKNNEGGIGLVIPNNVGHSIFYAGAKYEELNIASFTPGEVLSGKFNWEPEGDGGRNFISSIDHHERFIVLGLRRSIIVFKLNAKRSAPKEADELHEALQEYHEDGRSTEEAEYAALIDDTRDTQTESESESGKESEDGGSPKKAKYAAPIDDTGDTQTESESESGQESEDMSDTQMRLKIASESSETRGSHARDSEADSASDSGEIPCGRLGKNTRDTRHQSVGDFSEDQQKQLLSDNDRDFKALQAGVDSLQAILDKRTEGKP